MAQLLSNPNLDGFKTVTFFTDNENNTGAIEYPDNWEFVYTPMHPEDPNRIPQSLHRDRGFAISAGWRIWEAGYVQRGIHLKSGQRYLVKAVFMPDVNFGPGSPVDLHGVEWRFWIEGNGDKVWQEWESTSKGAYKQEEETLFVIEAVRDIKVDVYFKARSRWAANTCSLNIYTISLEEVPADYGGDSVARLGHVVPAPPGDDVILPHRVGPSGDIPAGRVEILRGQTLEESLTAEDIDVIAAGLREMDDLTANPTILAAFKRLADVLERLR